VVPDCGKFDLVKFDGVEVRSVLGFVVKSGDVKLDEVKLDFGADSCFVFVSKFVFVFAFEFGFAVKIGFELESKFGFGFVFVFGLFGLESESGFESESVIKLEISFWLFFCGVVDSFVCVDSFCSEFCSMFEFRLRLNFAFVFGAGEFGSVLMLFGAFG
jgi:hypothetical protein